MAPHLDQQHRFAAGGSTQGFVLDRLTGVRTDVPADAPSVRYQLIKVVNKVASK